MNYKRKILATAFLCGLIINLFPVHASLDEDSLISQWEVIQWNEANHVTWYSPPINFTVEIGSFINYTITTYDSANFTNPSSGIIEIGNHTTQTTNNNTGEVLALSIWGWFPGLVTSSDDWNLQKQVAQEVAEGQYTAGDLDIQELTYNHSGMLRRAINFTYQQDSPGNQNTTVTYDMQTGVLLEGFTEIQFTNYYVLELKLISSDLITESNLTSQLFLINIISITVLSFFWVFLRKRKKKKRILN